MITLAAAAIITLENSGIIGRSKNAITEQQKAEEMTRLIVIKNGILTDNIGKITVEEFIAELDKLDIIDGMQRTDEEGNTIVKTESGLDVYIRQDGEDDLKISFGETTPGSGNTSNVPKTTIGELVASAADYGKTVNYVADNGLSGWKVLYKQTVDGEEYVYLIASEMVTYDKMIVPLPSTSLGSTTVQLTDTVSKKYGYYNWSYGALSKIPTVQNPELWMANWSDYTANGNAQRAAIFLDETNWTAFKNTTASYKDYIVGVIGTPTLEMFVASWNAKKRTDPDNVEFYDKELTLTSNSSGYFVNGTSGKVTISTADSLYIWSTIAGTRAWLASPNGGGTLSDGVYTIDATNGLYPLSYVSSGGIRPVVCLKASTPATAGTNNDIELYNAPISKPIVDPNNATLSQLVTSAADYGKTVNYVADNGLSDWKVLYEQKVDGKDYVYLIASEKLTYDKMPTTLTGASVGSSTVQLTDTVSKKYGNYTWSYGGFSNLPTIQNPALWMANWTDYNSGSNTQRVALFLDETHWTAFKNTTASYKDYVVAATGTPTLEMFVASWNAKKRTDPDNVAVYDRELTITSGSLGYNVNGTTSNIAIPAVDSLYIWSTLEGTRIWLAAPSNSASVSDGIYTADFEKGIYPISYISGGTGVRPVVCLSGDVPAKAGTNNNYILK